MGLFDVKGKKKAADSEESTAEAILNFLKPWEGLTYDMQIYCFLR